MFHLFGETRQESVVNTLELQVTVLLVDSAVVSDGVALSSAPTTTAANQSGEDRDVEHSFFLHFWRRKDIFCRFSRKQSEESWKQEVRQSKRSGQQKSILPVYVVRADGLSFSHGFKSPSLSWAKQVQFDFVLLVPNMARPAVPAELTFLSSFQ